MIPSFYVTAGDGRKIQVITRQIISFSPFQNGTEINLLGRKKIACINRFAMPYKTGSVGKMTLIKSIRQLLNYEE